MNIPLDRLYQYIENIAEEICDDRVIIYRFWPHGSKKLSDFSTLRNYDSKTWLLNTKIFCADQEPLNYDYYENCDGNYDHEFNKIEERNKKLNFDMVFSTNLKHDYGELIYNYPILLHSEKRSEEIKKYQNDIYIPAYYWSHAIIARDWFRYAEHVTQRKNVNKTFLIYNRAWSGTREYRLYFTELLIRLNLQDYCKTSIGPVEPELGIHYNSHTFKNPAWKTQTVLENYFPINNTPSHYSADFDIEDYEATDIEVVLETLFDDSRLHLTEKSLRPIACGQPFILAGTHGSLEYLRSYGFKTFADVWDESYDTIEDPAKRLIAIANLMKHIAEWDPTTRERKMAQAQAIANGNKQHFFSQEFFDLVVNELKTNLKIAVSQPLFKIKNIELLIDFVEKWNNSEEIADCFNGKQTDTFINFSDRHEILNEIKNQYQTLLLENKII